MVCISCTEGISEHCSLCSAVLSHYGLKGNGLSPIYFKTIYVSLLTWCTATEPMTSCAATLIIQAYSTRSWCNGSVYPWAVICTWVQTRQPTSPRQSSADVCIDKELGSMQKCRNVVKFAVPNIVHYKQWNVLAVWVYCLASAASVLSSDLAFCMTFCS